MAELWSGNKLVNPGAEAGDLSGWAAENVSVVDGGSEGIRCFRLGANSRMEQIVSSVQAPKLKVAVSYLPESEQVEEEVRLYLQAILEYADGTADKIVFPGSGEVV